MFTEVKDFDSEVLSRPGLTLEDVLDEEGLIVQLSHHENPKLIQLYRYSYHLSHLSHLTPITSHSSIGVGVLYSPSPASYFTVLELSQRGSAVGVGIIRAHSPASYFTVLELSQRGVCSRCWNNPGALSCLVFYSI